MKYTSDKTKNTNKASVRRPVRCIQAAFSTKNAALGALASFLVACHASAAPFFFSTGDPDGKIATLSRPSTAGKLQTETADDFIVTNSIVLNEATFTGLIPSGAALSSIGQVEVEVYHVFPFDTAFPLSGNVPTRTNSPSDVEIVSATRDSANGSLSFTATLVSPSFTASNSVVNGINKKPGQRTNGEGAVTGQEVTITVRFNPPISLPADNYFFRPEVLLDNGDFLWLSAPKPIVAPGTPFAADRQTWIRNDALAPSEPTSRARDRLTQRFLCQAKPMQTQMELLTLWICARARRLAPLWTPRAAALTKSRHAAALLPGERGRTMANTFRVSPMRLKHSQRRV